MTVEEIRREALSLDPETRAELAQALLNSLDSLSEPEVERLWLEEAGRRDAELNDGTAHSSPAQDVLARARSRRA
jgi:Putative addiction module component